MIPASTDDQIKKAEVARAEVRTVLSSGQEEWCYCIGVPFVIAGWVILFIYLFQGKKL